MHKTRNDLPEATRKKVIKLLNDRLVDAIDLATQIKQAHWNVKGPQFIGLHELFDKVYAAVIDAMDEIAERAVQLGGTALGTARIVAKSSSLKEYPSDIYTCKDHVSAVSDVLAQFGKSIRQAADETDELHDVDTSDLLTGISRTIDKYLWFVEAHEQEKS